MVICPQAVVPLEIATVLCALALALGVVHLVYEVKLTFHVVHARRVATASFNPLAEAEAVAAKAWVAWPAEETVSPVSDLTVAPR